MSATDVVKRYGTRALVLLLFAVALYLTLRAVRWPLLLTVRLLDVAMTRVDRYLAAGAVLTETTKHPKEGTNDVH